MGFDLLVTPEEQTMYAHISELSVFTCVLTPKKMDGSKIPVASRGLFVLQHCLIVGLSTSCLSSFSF